MAILSEKKSMIFRRSVFVAEDIGIGDHFTKKNIRIIRPGMGLAPKYYGFLLGKKSKSNLKKGTPVTFENIL